MRYARSFLLGTALVTFVILLSVLIFYFSKGICPVGYLSCDNKTNCINQRSFCDGLYDCADKSDENINQCNLLSGNKDMLNELFSMGKWNITVPSNVFSRNCSIVESDVPAGCRCEDNFLVNCSDLGLEKIPMIYNAREIFLQNNRLRLDSDSLVGLEGLTQLDLSMNGLKTVPTGIFRPTKNLRVLFIMENPLTSLQPEILEGLSNLHWLFLSENSLTTIRIPPLPNLMWLRMSRNRLKLDKPEEFFPHLPSIYELWLDGNRIEIVKRGLLEKLEHLHTLFLQNNTIHTIEPKAFDSLINLRELDLSQNRLIVLPPEIFYASTHMYQLNLGNNTLHFTENLFAKSTQLSLLRLHGVELNSTEFSALKKIPNLTFVEFDTFQYCSYVPNVPRCVPNTDGVSNLEDLLSNLTLRISVWGVAFVTLAGNLLVLWGRGVSRDENKALSLIIRNLGVADMLMGIYLLVIGIQDLRYRGVYHQHSRDWMTSWGCIAIGAIAMTSSEVSILILAFMSVERFLLIANPLGGYARLSIHAARRSMITVWCIGLTLAILPIINWRNSTKFYGTSSGMCFPLHLREKYPLGWEYSAFIFLGVNFLGLIVIAAVYFGMFISVWRTRRAAPPSTADCEFAIRFFFIVLTDGCCWAPIICLRILNFFGIGMSGDVYAWLVVFIIPLNSAINPVLYTFTTPKYRDTFFFSCSQRSTNRSSNCDTESSRTSSNKNIMSLKNSNPENFKSQFIISDPITNNLNSTYSLNCKL